MISTTLAAAYEAQVAAAAGAAPPPPAMSTPAALTPEVKQLVASEVQRQLALENSEAAQNARNADPDPQSSGIARMLSDNQPHVFIAHADLDLTDATGTECFVTQGDVLQMVAPPPPAATAAQLVVLGTKAPGLPQGSRRYRTANRSARTCRTICARPSTPVWARCSPRQARGCRPSPPPAAASPGNRSFRRRRAATGSRRRQGDQRAGAGSRFG